MSFQTLPMKSQVRAQVNEDAYSIELIVKSEQVKRNNSFVSNAKVR